MGELFETFRDAPPPGMATRLPFRAQAYKVEALVGAAQIQESLAAAEELVDAMRTARERAAMLAIGNALIRSGRALEGAGEVRGALRLFEGASERLLEEPDDELRTLGVHAAINVGVMLGRLGRDGAAMLAMEAIVGVGEPALVALDSIIEHAGGPSGELPLERAPWALVVKGLVLEELGRLDEAHASYAQVVDRFGAEESPMAQLLVAAARDALAQRF